MSAEKEMTFGCCPSCGEKLPDLTVHQSVTVTGGFRVYGFLEGGTFAAPTPAALGEDTMIRGGDPKQVQGLTFTSDTALRVNP